MKLNDKHIAGIVRMKVVQESIINEQQKRNNEIRSRCLDRVNQNPSKYPEIDTTKILEMYFDDHIAANQVIEEKFSNLFSNPSKSFILRKTAMDVINKINLTGSFDIKVFAKFPVQTIEIVLSENEIYRCWYDGVKLYCIYIGIKEWINGNPAIQYHSISLNPTEGLKSWNFDHDKVKPYSDLIMKILIFLYFSEIKEVVLKSNAKIGNLSTGTYKNELKSSFILVDTTWNQISIRNTGFFVSGHFRLQPYGPDMSERRLIFIEEFQKHGYVRGAKKESVLTN